VTQFERSLLRWLNFDSTCFDPSRFAHRYGTSAILCGVGSLLVLDPIHRLARFLEAQFRERFGYPAWFVPCVGLCQVSIAYLNIYGGAKQWVAQKLLAALMGGAIYTLVRIDKSLPGAIAALSFLCFSCAVRSR
jgi:hypothetical protein